MIRLSGVDGTQMSRIDHCLFELVEGSLVQSCPLLLEICFKHPGQRGRYSPKSCDRLLVQSKHKPINCRTSWTVVGGGEPRIHKRVLEPGGTLIYRCRGIVGVDVVVHVPNRGVLGVPQRPSRKRECRQCARNNRLGKLLREPLSAAARVHRWLTAAEGDYPPPPLRPDKDFVASLRVMNGTLECPPQEGPHPYRDLPGGFSRHLQDALLPPWIIRRGSMAAWEARIVGKEWAREWGQWCAATHAPETPAQRYAAIPLEGWGPDTRPRATVIRGAGPDHPWNAATEEWLQAAPGPQTGWTADVSSLVRTPVPPRIVL